MRAGCGVVRGPRVCFPRASRHGRCGRMVSINSLGIESRIDRPIFVFGTGRSGTTLFFNLLSVHPHFAWFSNYSHLFPRWPGVALLSRLHDLAFADGLIRKDWRITPRPIETYAVLDYVTKSLFTAERLLGPQDAIPEITKRFRRVVTDHLRFQGKKRFIHKHTGFARTRFLDAIFPDAHFIHVYRDGRAVANSLVQAGWWKGLDSWQWGEMNSEYMQEYRESGKEPVVLAGIVWKTLMDEIEAECRFLPRSRLLRVSYGALIKDAEEVMDQVREFCGLPSSERFRRHYLATQISDMDTKWRRDLTERQKTLLQQSIGPHLTEYGFQGT